VSTAPVELDQPASDQDTQTEPPWITLVWNDPVNLMSYVTWVFQEYFGYDKTKAERLMLDVHEKGRAVVSNGSREEMERDTEAMHGYYSGAPRRMKRITPQEIGVPRIGHFGFFRAAFENTLWKPHLLPELA